MIVVAKIGTSSITTTDGEIDEAAVAKFCAEAAEPPSATRAEVPGACCCAPRRGREEHGPTAATSGANPAEPSAGLIRLEAEQRYEPKERMLDSLLIPGFLGDVWLSRYGGLSGRVVRLPRERHCSALRDLSKQER